MTAMTESTVSMARAGSTVDGAADNESVWIDRAREGDTEAFSALVELYQERAIHTAYAVIGNFEDARDVAQEAFVKSYLGLKNFRSDSRFYTWFYRILVNGCKDFLRKKTVRKDLLGRLEPSDEADEMTDPVLNVRDKARDAREQLISDELGDRIQECLERLPLQQRTAFGLRYLDGMELATIAVTMRLSVGAVKAHLWQAGQKMRVYLSDAAEQPERRVL